LRTVGSEGGLDVDAKARNLARDVPVGPENKPADEILHYLQEQETTMALVVDEWGSFLGIVTVENIFEIVGEIRDEFDEKKPVVRKLDEDGSYQIDGRASIRDVNEALGSGFASEDFGSLGGLVLGSLGRAPEVGDEVVLDGYVVRVNEVDGPRVAQVVVREQTENGGRKER